MTFLVGRVRRDVLLNLAGQGLPLCAAAIAMPHLVAGLGADRLGILTIAWVLIGYFGLFDLGIGRALTREISLSLAREAPEDALRASAAGLLMLVGLGVLAAMVLGSAASWLAQDALQVSAGLLAETESALRLLAVGIPLTIVATGLSSVLEGRQQFVVLNLIKIPTGVLLFAAPVVALSFGKSLVIVVGSLVISRAVTLLAFIAVSARYLPSSLHDWVFHRRESSRLLSFGGWLTVSNVVGPIMLYSDRFFVANIVAIGAVAYYTVPFEIVTKILVVPGAVLGVMFPAFVRAYAQDGAAVAACYSTALKYVVAGVLPLVSVVLVFAEPAISIWLNDDFAERSSLIAQLLAIGVLFNAIALVSQALVQASGRPDLTAKLHLVEAPLYFGYLMFFLGSYGVEGAAYAWVVRVGFSAVVLAYFARRSYRNPQE